MLAGEVLGKDRQGRSSGALVPASVTQWIQLKDREKDGSTQYSLAETEQQARWG